MNRITLGVLLIGIFIIQWVYYIMIGFDIIIHLFPYTFLILAFLIVFERDEKKHEYRRTPFISFQTAVIFGFLFIIIYVIGFSYPSLNFLPWNANAILIIVLSSYHKSFHQQRILHNNDL